MTTLFALSQRASLGAALAFAMLLSACAPATRVTLLPQVGGVPNAVVTTTGQGAQVLAQPYAVAEVSRSGSMGLATTTADTVRERHPPLLALDANDRLSLDRAQAVRALLIERGFAPEQIDAMGRGEREPVMATEDEVAKPHNRRADVLVRLPQMTHRRT